jgi:protein-histidine pros-kinase
MPDAGGHGMLGGEVLHRLIEAAPDGLVVVDDEGTIVFVNRTAEQLFGWKRTELLGRPVEVLLPERYRAAHVQHRQVYLAAPRRRPMGSGLELWARRRDSSEFPVDISLSPVETERGRLIMAAVRDATARRQAEEERARLLAQAQAAEARYRGLFEGAADAIVLVDARGRYIEANAAATALLGYTRDELLQKRVGDLIAAGPAGVLAAFARLRREGQLEGEAELRRKDGTVVPVEMRWRAVADPSSDVYLGIWRDISARRELARQQQDFTALVVHELGNPVTTIRGYVQLLERGLAEPPRAATAILGEVERLERLLAELREVARLDAAVLRLQRRQIDLTALVRDTVARVQTHTTRHHLRIEETAGRLVGWWDPLRLTQVLENLLSNAIKYSPHGGEIVVRVERTGAAASLSVTDRGMGIDPQELPRLFQRFTRTAAAQRSKASGLGLGLYIARTLVEAHGGRIEVTSTAGQGSTFTVTLPLRRPVRRLSRRAAEQPAGRLA